METDECKLFNPERSARNTNSPANWRSPLGEEHDQTSSLHYLYGALNSEKPQALSDHPRSISQKQFKKKELPGKGCNQEVLHLLVKLQLQAEERGVVSIKGVCANRYLAMKEDGRLLASKCVTDECFFFERLESNNYNTYRSRKYSSWYVALKRTGQYKLGPKTGPGQKAILFLPMSAKS
ncbi:heparin-binding growth [Lynx pardinus]|uniref:Fibroblast growth factor n=1 Tax=Lynx pardinus TaxID=191816 RepID=A0A485PBE6_LYNPA|nr:heparin-binding growth [Lynx pardinus]